MRSLSTITAQASHYTGRTDKSAPILVLANDNDSRSIDVTNTALDALVWACLLLGAVPGIIVAVLLGAPAEAWRWVRGKR